LIIFCFSGTLFSQSDANKLHFDGYALGFGIRKLDVNNFLIADIPISEAKIPLGTDCVKFNYGGHLAWGISKFFVEWNNKGGLHFYPFRDYFSVYITAHIGTFFFDNISYMSSLGTNIEIPIQQNATISIGLEYFYRNSCDLIDYITFPSISNSDSEEAIDIDSKGIGVKIGIKL